MFNQEMVTEIVLQMKDSVVMFKLLLGTMFTSFKKEES